MKIMEHGVELEIVQGNIIAQADVSAVVNAANAQLLKGGGVAGAIHGVAGPGLERECRPLAPIRPGEAVITGGHNLPNKHVIHCLGPVYGVNEPAAEILANCYKNALCLAEQNRIESIAFPAISTGIFGYPVEEAAYVALRTILAVIPGLKSVKKVRIVLYSKNDQAIHEKVLSRLLKS